MVQDVFTAGIKLTQPCICKCDNKGKVHDDEEVIKSSHVLSSPDRQNFQWIQNIRWMQIVKEVQQQFKGCNGKKNPTEPTNSMN